MDVDVELEDVVVSKVGLTFGDANVEGSAAAEEL